MHVPCCRIAYGNENGLVIVDYIQNTCLLNMGTPELYGAADPYQRVPRSPKKADSKDKDDDRDRSPSSDQVNWLPHIFSLSDFFLINNILYDIKTAVIYLCTFDIPS